MDCTSISENTATISDAYTNPSLSEVESEDVLLECSMDGGLESLSTGPGGDFKIPGTLTETSVDLKGVVTSHTESEAYQATDNTSSIFRKNPSSSMKTGQSQLVVIDAMLKDAANELKSGCLQWTHIFKESEEFENFCPTRVEKLLCEAKALEENLRQQKEQLMQRLKTLSLTLQTI